MGLWNTIKNTLRGAADKADSALQDVERDSKYAIEDSKKQIAEFQTKIAGVMGRNKLLVRQRDEAAKEVDKFLGLAKKAKAAGNMDDARELLTSKGTHQSNLDTLNGQIEANERIISSLRSQLESNRARVANAESNRTRLLAQNEGAKIRRELAKASTDFDSNSPLSALDSLEEAVAKNEAEAESYEDLAGAANPSADLAKKYSTPNVDDELASL